MSDILDNVIVSAILNAQIYTKVRFDNAKDTQELLSAAERNFEVIKEVVDEKMRPRIEQMLNERLESDLAKGDVFMKVGDKLYEIQEQS